VAQDLWMKDFGDMNFAEMKKPNREEK